MVTFREVIRELFYEKTRTVLIITAIAWGTFSIVFTLSIGEGLRLNFARVMANAGDRLLVVSPGVTSKNYRGMRTNRPLKFTRKDVKAIIALPNVAQVTVRYDFDAMAHYRDQKSFIRVRAIHPKYAAIHNIRVGSKQRFISFLDMQKRSSVIVLGEKTANQLFPKENPIGNIIYIDNHPFEVIGVMQKKMQMSSSGMPYAWLNWIPASTYELLNNPSKIDNIDVGYKNFAGIEQTKKIIQKIIAINHEADPTDQSIVNFVDMAEEQKKVNRFFVNMQIFLGIVGGLTLLLAGVGIANVMYATVKRLTWQIGLQMALGATTWHIVSRYIIESLVATTVGGLIGMVITILGVYLIYLIPMNHYLFTDVFGKPMPVISFLVIAIVIGVLGITGFLAGLFPALKAAKIDPAEALVYE